MINAGIIGVSGFGGVHYGDLKREQAAGKVRILGATIRPEDREADKVAYLESIGCEIFPSYDKMFAKLAGKLDICCIPTGIAWHCPMTLAALAAGANVFVEKPVAATVAEADAMEQAARKNGKFVAVGYQTIYQPETRRIKELLISGKLGAPKRLKCYALWPRTNAYYNRNGWAGHLFDQAGTPILDSPFTNALAHYLNLLLFYAGTSFESSAKVISVDSQMLRANPIQSCDTANIHCITAEGREIRFIISHAIADHQNPLSVIECEKGSIEYSQQETVVRDSSGKEIDRFASAAGEEIRQNVWNSLFARLEKPDSFFCSIAIAKAPLGVSNAVYDSAPIADVPASQMDVQITEEGAQLRVVRGLADIIRSAYAENRAFTLKELPYVLEPSVMNLADYKGFEKRLY